MLGTGLHLLRLLVMRGDQVEEQRKRLERKELQGPGATAAGASSRAARTTPSASCDPGPRCPVWRQADQAVTAVSGADAGTDLGREGRRNSQVVIPT